MPRKKKTANEMSDRELLRQAFPEVVVRRIEEELDRVNAEKSGDSESDFLDTDKSNE